MRKFFTDKGVEVSAGEIWFDRNGNECSYRDDRSLRVRTVNNEPTLTIQSEADSCDINKILEKFNATGLMSNIRTDPPMFGDFTNISDYQSAVIQIQEAEESFMSLPASIRKRFNNDPGELIDFLGNPDNRAEAIKLGLVDAPQPSQVAQGASTPPSQEGDQNSADQSST